MKYAFLGIAVVLAALSVAAWLWTPPDPYDYRGGLLRAVLRVGDLDHDMRVSRSEFERLLAVYDADHDSATLRSEIEAGPNWREQFLGVFERIDVDADGRIGSEERRLLFRNLDSSGDEVLTACDSPAPPVLLTWVTDDNPVRREQLQLFNAYHPEYHVQIDPATLSTEKAMVQCLAGVGPDIIDCYTPLTLAAFVHSGIAMDVTDALAARGVDTREVWPCLYPLIVLDGRLYGHPGNASADAIWYNKRMFDEAGEAYPRPDWTWEECVAIAKRLTKRDARGRPVQFGLMTGRFAWRYTFLPQWGGSIYTAEGTRCALDRPEALAAAQFFQDLIVKHGVCPSATEEIAMSSQGGWGLGEQNWFVSERTAMALGGRWWLCTLRNGAFRHIETGVAPIPRGPRPNQIGHGRASLVNANGKHLEGALTFVAFLHGKEWNQLMSRQADGLGPVKKYHYGDYEEAYLHEPAHPDEIYNAVWRQAMEEAVAEPSSPFVNGQQVERILFRQQDMIVGGQKSAEQAMRDSVREINQAIIEQLRQDPDLKAKYVNLVRNGASPAWDNAEQAP